MIKIGAPTRLRLFGIRAAAACALFSCGCTFASNVELLVDFDTGPPRVAAPAVPSPYGFYQSPNHQATLGEFTLFNAEDDVHGWELWKTDGTREGTSLLKDIAPGIRASNPSDFHVRSGRLYFTAYLLSYKRAWFVSDGTSSGTYPVTDDPILDHVGTGSSVGAAGRSTVLAYGSDRSELWLHKPTDVQAVPTYDSLDVQPFRSPRIRCDLADKTLFLAGPTYQATQLWSTDGTADRTSLIAEFDWIKDPLHVVRTPGCFNSRYFFVAAIGDEVKLWETDGTSEGTVPVDLGSLPDGTIPDLLGFGDGAIYYQHYATADRQASGLYAYDALAGTTATLIDKTDAQGVYSLASSNNFMLAAYYSEQLNESRVSSVTASGVETLETGTYGYASDATVIDDRVAYFGLRNVGTVTDGTLNGTFELTAAFTQFTDDTSAPIRYSGNIFSIGDDIVFRVPERPRLNAELWRSPNGLEPAESFAYTVSPTAASDPLTVYAGQHAALVCADADADQSSTPELFAVSLDGRYQPRPELKQLTYGICDPPLSFRADGETYFSIGRTSTRIYRLDQRSLETYFVWKSPGRTRQSYQQPVSFNGRHYFIAGNSNNRPTLYAVNLQSGDAIELRAFRQADYFSFPQVGMASTSRGVFFTGVGLTGEEPFFSDGTPEGTVRVADISMDGGSSPRNYVALGDRAAFIASADGAPSSLWVSDGSPGGTYELADAESVGEAASLSMFQADIGPIVVARRSDGRLEYYTLQENGELTPFEYWSGPGNTCLSLENFRQANVFTLVDDGRLDRQLLHVDCKNSRVTSLIEPQVPGQNAYPTTPVSAGELLFYSAFRKDSGVELFVYDQETRKVQLVSDIAPGSASSSPGATRRRANISHVGDRIIFAADAGAGNRELWSAPSTGIRLRVLRNRDTSAEFEISLSRATNAPLLVTYELESDSIQSTTSIKFENGQRLHRLPVPPGVEHARLSVLSETNAIRLSNTVTVSTSITIFSNGFDE